MMSNRDIADYSYDEDGPSDSTATCPDCDGQVHTNAVETVCADCGLVVDEHPIDHGPEWRSFDDDTTNRTRTGAPLTPTRHDRGLSTEIGRKTDGNGNQLGGRTRRKFDRLRRAHARGRFTSKRERNLAHGCTEVRRVVSALGLGSGLRDQSCAYFRTAQSEDLLVGRSIESMAAASVFAACRCAGLPRMIEDVSAVAQCSEERLHHAYTVLNIELGLPAQPVPPREYVPRFASELDVSTAIRRRAVELAEQAEATGLTSDGTPTGVAGACLYRAANEQDRRLTQQAVADVAHCSVVTIRTHRDTLLEMES